MKNSTLTVYTFVIVFLSIMLTVNGQSIPLNPKFISSNTSICPDNTIQYSDSSLGNIKEWNWTFPSTSNEKNPIIKYSNSGSFDVKLTIKDSLGNSKSKIEYAFVKVNELVKASFNYGSIVSNCYEIEFFVNNNLNSVTYLWKFDDGSTSTDPNPMHKFTKEGEHKVTLCIEGPCNRDCVTETIGIFCVPVADFTSDVKVVCAGNKVKYSSLSSDNVIIYV